jgi:hypothetical protein
VSYEIMARTGVDIAALIAMVMVLRLSLGGLREDIRSLNTAMMKVAIRLGQLIGREDPTPVREAKEDVLKRIYERGKR